MPEFRMPSLGADMDAGVLVEWKVKPGDVVRRGDIVAVVETQKGAIDVEIFEPGVIERLLVPVGVKVPVDTPLAHLAAPGAAPAPPDTSPPSLVIPAPPDTSPSPPASADAGGPASARPGTAAAAGDAAPARDPEAAAAAPAPALAARRTPAPSDISPTPPAPSDTSPTPAAARAEGPPASPRARRLAHELGVNLRHVPGTGPHASITGDDVQRAAEAARRPSPQEAMRAAIAAAMARSKRTIPHYYLAHTVDLTLALAWMAEQNRARPVPERLLPAALLLKAIARALRKVPELNGRYDADPFRPSPAVHLGVAISLRGGGLVAPALHDAADLALGDLMARLRDLTARARAGALRSSELADPTITVTSLGDQGVDDVFGVIYPPQVALVGVGTPALRPWVVGGAIAPRTLVRLSLAADHRVSDGHRGALFLAAVDRLLQEPAAL